MTKILSVRWSAYQLKWYVGKETLVLKAILWLAYDNTSNWFILLHKSKNKQISKQANRKSLSCIVVTQPSKVVVENGYSEIFGNIYSFSI